VLIKRYVVYTIKLQKYLPRNENFYVLYLQFNKTKEMRLYSSGIGCHLIWRTDISRIYSSETLTLPYKSTPHHKWWDPNLYIQCRCKFSSHKTGVYKRTQSGNKYYNLGLPKYHLWGADIAMCREKVQLCRLRNLPRRGSWNINQTHTHLIHRVLRWSLKKAVLK
jgi:hypothetical protein